MLPVGRRNFDDDEIKLNLSRKEMDDIMSTYQDMDKKEFDEILKKIITSKMIPDRHLFKKDCKLRENNVLVKC